MTRWLCAALWFLAVMFLLACIAGATEPPASPQSSPRTFVPPEACPDRESCPTGFWVFQAPECVYHNLRGPGGTVIVFEDGTARQCRCGLVWLLTKKQEPPSAQVSCKWIDDVDEAMADDH